MSTEAMDYRKLYGLPPREVEEVTQPVGPATQPEPQPGRCYVCDRSGSVFGAPALCASCRGYLSRVRKSNGGGQ